MVKVTDCGCCDCNCDDAQLRETIKERALSSINKIYTFDNRTFWPDGTGMVTIPLPTQEQLNKIESVAELTDQVAKNTKDIGTNAELIAGEQTQIDSLKTTLETSYQAIVQKGSANGYAGLDNNARVPLAQLYAGTSANQVPLIGKQLLANEMLVVDADGLTVRSKPIVQTLSFRGIYPAKSALPSEGNVSGDYAIVSDGTAQEDTGYYVWGYNTATSEYEWVWTILFDANSYQLISNLVTEISDSSDDSHYPSAKAVKDYHDASVGTLEQEIDTINSDVAEIQTTVGKHTTKLATHDTEITAVNTLANRAYDDAEISGSTITLTRGNGGTTQIKIPVTKIDYLPIYNLFIPTKIPFTVTRVTTTKYTRNQLATWTDVPRKQVSAGSSAVIYGFDYDTQTPLYSPYIKEIIFDATSQIAHPTSLPTQTMYSSVDSRSMIQTAFNNHVSTKLTSGTFTIGGYLNQHITIDDKNYFANEYANFNITINSDSSITVGTITNPPLIWNDDDAEFIVVYVKRIS